MSLIERAAQRMANPPAAKPAEPRPEPKLDAAPGRSTPFADAIERLEPAIAAAVAEAPARPAPAADTPAVIAAPTPAREPAPAQVRQETPVAGPSLRIHLEALRARGFVMPSGEPSPMAQEFRVIKRPLLANALGRGATEVRHGRRIMITSAFPGEGKSFTAINLAMSIAAERDTRVMLIDADVARPSIPRELGIETGPGLMDWLVDGGPDLAQLVMPTNVDKLALLPAGRRHTHATELLASDSMQRLLEALSTRYPDHVLIFDSPPLLVTTESRVLASYMGQIVMVVEAGKTPRDAVTDAIAKIEGCEVVGMVLNKSREGGAGGYYGYGGYGYGSQ